MGWIYAIGFLAQLFFSARIVIQWVLSERAHRIVSPSAYWICSLAGSWLLFLYGWLREDFAIILGQLISYYVYLWNLNIKGIYGKIPRLARFVLVATPVAALAAIAGHADAFVDSFLRNEQVPLALVYQWIYSARHGESSLPIGFWVMSLAGSAMIVCYGVARLDPVLILGQSVGFGAYARNLFIGYGNRHEKQ